MSQPFLHCQGVSKSFATVRAVDNVDIDVECGRILALVGPSGCGKTTFLRLIAGFEHPDSGRIVLSERTLSGEGIFVPPDKRRVGMVFQDYALFPHLSVAANIAFGIKQRAGRKERVAELLALVGLDGLEQRMPYQLSGGQQQRVALARALAAQPQLLLLDEPFSNLDPGMRARVRAEVRQIIASLGITAIFVTHDQEEALSLAEEVAVMLNGRILQKGRPNEVYLHPSCRAVGEFLGDANFLRGIVRNGLLECELGSVPVAASLQGSVEVMVRPEDLKLTEANGGQEVQIVQCEYYGHDQMVTVRTGGGRLIRVRTQPDPKLVLGKQLSLSLNGSVVVFPPSE